MLIREPTNLGAALWQQRKLRSTDGTVRGGILWFLPTSEQLRTYAHVHFAHALIHKGLRRMPTIFTAIPCTSVSFTTRWGHLDVSIALPSGSYGFSAGNAHFWPT